MKRQIGELNSWLFFQPKRMYRGAEALPTSKRVHHGTILPTTPIARGIEVQFDLPSCARVSFAVVGFCRYFFSVFRTYPRFQNASRTETCTVKRDNHRIRRECTCFYKNFSKPWGNTIFSRHCFYCTKTRCSACGFCRETGVRCVELFQTSARRPNRIARFA